MAPPLPSPYSCPRHRAGVGLEGAVGNGAVSLLEATPDPHGGPTPPHSLPGRPPASAPGTGPDAEWELEPGSNSWAHWCIPRQGPLPPFPGPRTSPFPGCTPPPKTHCLGCGQRKLPGDHWLGGLACPLATGTQDQPPTGPQEAPPLSPVLVFMGTFPAGIHTPEWGRGNWQGSCPLSSGDYVRGQDPSNSRSSFAWICVESCRLGAAEPSRQHAWALCLLPWEQVPAPCWQTVGGANFFLWPARLC